jgi:tetratricopeptide (TPR) repeat protein
MKNKSKADGKSVALGIIGVGFLIFLIVAYPREGSDDTLYLYYVLALLAMLIIASAVELIYILLVPYLQRRKAALHALGKSGITKIARDKTARIAYKGIYAFFKDDYPKAEEYLNLALSRSDIRQNQLFCIEWLIKLYEVTENDFKLLWCFRKAVEYAPDNPEAQARLGHAYFTDGKLDKAMYCFEQALRYDPNNGYSYYSMAKIYMVRGEDDKAVETLEQLTKINENHPLVYAELATFAAMRGEREKCEEYYKKAQLCGYNTPDELNKRITAILEFGKAEASGADLPREYYRKIVRSGEN